MAAAETADASRLILAIPLVETMVLSSAIA